ncbi:MAG: hypothetical protein ACLS8R_04590 [Anaeromassilibacillus sp.]
MDENGVVTALTEGTTTVTAQVSGTEPPGELRGNRWNIGAGKSHVDRPLYEGCQPHRERRTAAYCGPARQI